jgi:hypothetical protein
MKRVLNNKGFGAKEIIIMLLLLLGLFAIGTNLVSTYIGGDKYTRPMKLQADNFVKMVSVYKDKNTKDGTTVYYLYDLSNGQDSNELVDPERKSRSCDIYESYVDIEAPKKVLLKCGKYLIKGEYQNKYELYEVGDWQKEKIPDSESNFLYNYTVDGKEVFPDYVTESEFIQKFNKMNETNCISIDEVYGYVNKKENEQVLMDMFYRERKLIKEY